MDQRSAKTARKDDSALACRPAGSAARSNASASHRNVLPRAAAAARFAEVRQQIAYVSQSGLAALANAARDELLPNNFCTRSLIREGRDHLCKEVTPYGPLHREVQLEMNDGELADFEVQDPFAMLFKVCSSSRSFSMMV